MTATNDTTRIAGLARTLVLLAGDTRATYDAIGRGSVPEISIGQWRRLQAVEDMVKELDVIALQIEPSKYELAAKAKGWIVDDKMFVNHRLQTTALDSSPLDACGWEDLCREAEINV